MQNSYFCKNSYLNVYELASKKSNISTQLIYGEKFRIIGKKKDFFKIKTDFDNYLGFIKIKKFNKVLNKTHKVSILKSKIYNKPKNNIKFLTKKYLPFSSEIQIINKKNNFVMFEKNKWIKLNELQILNKKNYNFSKILKLFLNIKYKWGGKTFDGIDCSALLKFFINITINSFQEIQKIKLKSKKVLRIKKYLKKEILFFGKDMLPFV